MKERGILFSAPMVRALLDGTKTQTRRAVKPAPTQALDTTAHVAAFIDRVPAVDGGRVVGHTDVLRKCPYGVPGDRLWVRETWACAEDRLYQHDKQNVIYRADHMPHRGRWRPSLFMPRWASRITLEITGVRVERLHDISDADIRAEGVTAEAVRALLGRDVVDINPRSTTPTPIADLSLRQLWQVGWTAINGAASWDANPWLWCLTFRRVVQP